jgi:hypothetical protein
MFDPLGALLTTMFALGNKVAPPPQETPPACEAYVSNRMDRLITTFGLPFLFTQVIILIVDMSGIMALLMFAVRQGSRKGLLEHLARLTPEEREAKLKSLWKEYGIKTEKASNVKVGEKEGQAVQVSMDRAEKGVASWS